ncbi:diagnostic antigen [Trypanosoma grayi]|uniref:diagnostic antigen n=1 Tax=Trypanosoma grayi TaxID=71804 RepID=UPI0004F4967D|nr:diagnostic antigen [Trypanosoma grayi]KEG09838.1 diagnostic antigen [Trypanosoma grayi]
MSSKICHVVLFCLEPVKAAEKLVEPTVRHHLQLMRDTIPGLLEVNFGAAASALYKDYVDCTNGYTHCLVSRHVDAAALHVYAGHPNHMSFAEIMKSLGTKPPIRIDFEIKE